MAQASASAANGNGAYNGDYPLTDIPAPHPHDVLCGRGGGTNNHIGNSHWRMLVAANKQLYITLPKRQKMLLSRSIVNAVRSQNPPGRFLQKDSKSNKWFDVGDQRAQEKTSQALREGAPDIRKKVAAEKDKDGPSTEKPAATPGPKATPAKEPPKPTTNRNNHHTSKSNSVPNGVPSSSANPPPAAVAPPAHAMPAQQQQQPQQQQPPPMMAQQPYMMNGGIPMHPYQMQQMQQQQQHHQAAGYPMMQQQHYPQMQAQGMPMQGYPPMVMNEQGMMVPAFAGMHPQLMQQQQMHMQHQMAQMQHMQQQQQHQHQQQQMPTNMPPPPQNSGSADSEPIPFTPVTSQQQAQAQPQPQQSSSQHAQQPQQQPVAAGVNPNVPSFDEFISVPPPDGGLEPAGLSYGSLMMTDNEMHKLTSGGASFGMAKQHQHQQQQGEQMPEPTGIMENAPGASFGDVSMMSIGTRKLEDGGFSFGSAMSFGTTQMVDGGLDAIGASFGSLSLDTRNRETLFHQLELAAAGPEIPPMLNTTKSTANLLECSDSEEEEEIDESQKFAIARKKSEAWERMQASVANNLSSQKSTESKEVMPPPIPRDQTGTDIAVPTTTFGRDFSQLSAFDDGNDDDDDDDDVALPPPPAQLEKNDDDDDKLDMYLIHQQTSGS